MHHIRHLAAMGALQLLTAVLLMALCLFDATAQTTAVPPPPTASTLAGRIMVSDILTRAEEDEQRVRWAERLLDAPDPVDHLSEALDDIARPVAAKFHTTDGTALRELPAMRLVSLSRHWTFDARRYDRWETQARRALAPYADSALQLAQRRAAWSTARAEGVLDSVPPALFGRVDGVLKEIDAAENALGLALARQFELTQRGNALKARIQAGGREVSIALGDTDRGLLSTDAPPLWQGLGLGPDMRAGLSLAAIHQGFEIERQFAVDYHAAATRNQQALWVVQLLLVPLILWLFLRSRHLAKRQDPPEAMPLALRRPISAWLLLSMLAVLVLEPDAPLLVQEFALVVALVPVLRLLPVGKISALGMWPYMAAALYALDRLSVVALADGDLYRLFLLALNALAFGITLLLMRRAKREAITQSTRLAWYVWPVSWTVLIVLTLATVSNIAGNLSLAETLTSGVIDSGYMALMLYASVAVGSALFRALLEQPELARRHFIRDQEWMLKIAFTRLLIVGTAIGWLLYSMERFRVLRPVYNATLSIMSVGLEVGEFSLHIGDILVFLISAVLAYWSARVVRRLLRDELPHHSKLPRGVGNSIASLSYYGVLMLGLFVALSAAGVKVGQLALVFGALGVGIGFGLQNLVSSFISGLILMFERPIQPGDVVQAEEIFGTVREIGLRSTIIRTFDGADVIVPNGLLLGSNLTNWTMFDRTRRIELKLNVPLGADPAQVLGVLGTAARATQGVAEHPAPVVLLDNYDENALHFLVRAWTQDVSIFASVKADLLVNLLAALKAAGISVPYKQVDLHLHSVREPIETVLRAGRPTDAL